MTGKPLVSVLMTAYNREAYIAEAIESVLSDSFTDFELIITDDGSKDDTVNIAKTFAEKDTRVSVYTNKENLGDYKNRNEAAKYARGKYIKYLDSDDYFIPGGLKYCVQSMEDNAEADWAMSCILKPAINKVLTPKEAIHKHFFEEVFLTMGPGGTILKKDFFCNIGMFPIKYGPANDQYFNLLAASKGNLLLLNKEFFHYRTHEGQERYNYYSYLVNLYVHLNDAVAQLDLNLNAVQKKYILNKNKRRFLKNAFDFFSDTRDLKKVQQAIREAKYTYADAFKAVFQ